MSRANVCPFESGDCLRPAEKVIRDGGILVYPTDTLYGFGVDARNDSALERLSRLKEREGPWSITVPDEKMLNRYGIVPQDRQEFVKSRLPGKVTFVLMAKRSDISPHVLGKNNTVGMRIPNHPFPIMLTKELQFPITSTSVNKTGQSPMNDPSVIGKVFGNKIELIVDDGILPPSGGSRIYDLSGRDVSILREGK